MSLYKNTSLVLTGTLLANIMAYVFNIIVARKIGPGAYGVLGALLAIFSLVSWIYMSLFSGVTKQVAQLDTENGAKRLSTFYFSAQREVILFLLVIALGVVASSGLLSSCFRIPSIGLVILTGILLWINGMQYFYQGVLTGLRQYMQISKVKVLEAAARLLAVVVLLYMGLGLFGVLLAYGLGYTIGYFWSRQKIKGKIARFDGQYFMNRKHFYTIGSKFLVLGMLYQLVFYGSSLYFQHYHSSTENGFWTAGLTISNISFVFSNAVLQVVLPELSGEKNQHKRTEIIRKALLVILGTTGIASLICWTFPEMIIELFYGKSYLGSAKFLKWQGLLILVLALVQFAFTIRFSRSSTTEAQP